ncbi:MAG: tRNA-intron lyase, partial [Nitrosopumilaceae archaeon]|nr:tRNA-intron lyase [Nitrosopumilaceae archaeon]NIU87394.1 tRNA-intron lyase [Nitrosopumilaceae archaeon]NIV65905.1 tRNA-intron lyase [Nitrosopumilaceae archaeon]NIX61526.1 tRNA-intron lyase [Nitrosopumilaceae archaeon]
METKNDLLKMEVEEEPQVFGILENDLTLIDNPDMIHELELKGYG